MPAPPKPRLAYVDWMRGLACVMMFQTHCYDAWLGGAARKSRFFMYSQLGGTLPAPLFLFLAGISCALVTENLRAKGVSPVQVARTTILRGAEIFGLALLFRLQEFGIAWPWAPWTDLARVDVLNIIGLSLMAMGAACWMAAAAMVSAGRKGNVRAASMVVAVAAMVAIAAATPLLWTTWRPRFLPWPLESYINGVHIFDQPQPWLFPVFPWMGFSFAGLAVGFLLLGGWARAHEGTMITLLGVAGLTGLALAHKVDAQAWQVYPVYDFWHTSPAFFVIRVGILLLILLGIYVWCRWGLGQWGFSPLIQLGRTSLLVYWVHIEFVYGRFSLLPHQSNSIGKASVGLLIIFLAMLLLSVLRTRLKQKPIRVPDFLRRRAAAA